jgi:hypothetical protein
VLRRSASRTRTSLNVDRRQGRLRLRGHSQGQRPGVRRAQRDRRGDDRLRHRPTPTRSDGTGQARRLRPHHLKTLRR